MRLVDISPEPAVLLATSDAGQQRYMQANPFLSGPEEPLNRSIFDALPKIISVRRPRSGCEIRRLSPEECSLVPEVEARARSLFNAMTLSEKEIANAFSNWAWKFRDISTGASTILVLGCGTGVELIFLRAAAPAAHIVAVDWKDALFPQLKETADIDFRKINIVQYLADCIDQFDVVFSNHVLEHIYDPNHVLTLLRHRLVPSGMMLASLPLDGQHLASDTLARLFSTLHRTDLGEFDLGHPWKTTASDLHQTLIDAQFETVHFTQRECHLSVGTIGDEQELSALRIRGRRLNSLVFAPLKYTIRKFFPAHPPQSVLRVLYGLERRVWFGSNNLKNLTTPEILAMATAPRS